MNIEQAVLENLKQLPLKQQEEVLNFSEFLKQKSSTSLPSPEPNLAPEERVKKWLDFVATLPKTSANLPEEALHRDTMYEDEY
jgi:hypothetical protein